MCESGGDHYVRMGLVVVGLERVGVECVYRRVCVLGRVWCRVKVLVVMRGCVSKSVLCRVLNVGLCAGGALLEMGWLLVYWELEDVVRAFHLRSLIVYGAFSIHIMIIGRSCGSDLIPLIIKRMVVR